MGPGPSPNRLMGPLTFPLTGTASGSCEVGTVALGALLRLAMAPRCDPGMVSAEQDVGDVEVPPLRGPGEHWPLKKCGHGS